MKKIIHFLPLFIILTVSAFLRLYRIGDYMTFLGDEGRDALTVYNILHGHLTLLGPTSSVGGFFLGPAYYYFMAPFLFLFQYNPVGPAVMVGLFGVATVFLVYKIGTEFFDEHVGLLAAAMYTISPLVIAYSRSSWNPNLMPFFTLSTLYLLYKALVKNKTFYFLVVGLFFGLLMQFHYLATFVGLIIAVYIFLSVFFLLNYDSGIKNKSISLIKDYLLIFVGFIIGFSPFLAFEARHGFPNTISVFKFIFASKDVQVGSGNFFGIISDVFFRLFGRLITAFPPPEQISFGAHTDIAVWYTLTIILAIGSSLYFFFQVKKAYFKQEKIKLIQLMVLLVWFVLGILLFGLYKKQIYDYYFEFIFPLPFILASSFLVFLFRKNLITKAISIMSVIVIILINLEGVPFRYPANRQYDQVKGISQSVLRQTNGKPYNFALIAGGNSDHAYRYFFTIFGRPPVTILNPSVDPERKSVTDQLLVVCEMQCHPLGYSLWEVAGFGRAEIEKEWNVSVVQVYKLIHLK